MLLVGERFLFLRLLKSRAVFAPRFHTLTGVHFGRSRRLSRWFNTATNSKAEAVDHHFRALPVLIPRKSSNQAPRIKDGRIQVYSDISDRHVDISQFWLRSYIKRDHCQCSVCFHGVTKQRVVETFDEIPFDISIFSSSVGEDGKGVHVTWSDGHKSYYSMKWLEESGMKKDPRSAERQGIVEMEFWTGDNIKANPPSVPYDSIMSSDEGLRKWLELVRKFGFSYVDDCPPTPKATEKLLMRVAFIRNTHYGGFYDFTADLSSGDTAYTQLGIGPHTDNTYFTDPAGLQMFHLLSHTNGSGGASQLVDGFGAAEELQKQDPDAYKVLSTVRVGSHASGGADGSIQPLEASPVLVHDPQAGYLTQVRWNTTDRSAIDMPVEEMDRWYNAARKWAGILRKREYWEQLKPGRPLMFDNWRVLHGRSAFTGNRRMCGGYINRDDFISRFKILNWGKDEILKQVTRG